MPKKIIDNREEDSAEAMPLPPTNGDKKPNPQPAMPQSQPAEGPPAQTESSEKAKTDLEASAEIRHLDATSEKSMKKPQDKKEKGYSPVKDLLGERRKQVHKLNTNRHSLTMEFFSASSGEMMARGLSSYDKDAFEKRFNEIAGMDTSARLKQAAKARHDLVSMSVFRKSKRLNSKDRNKNNLFVPKNYLGVEMTPEAAMALESEKFRKGYEKNLKNATRLILRSQKPEADMSQIDHLLDTEGKVDLNAHKLNNHVTKNEKRDLAGYAFAFGIWTQKEKLKDAELSEDRKKMLRSDINNRGLAFAASSGPDEDNPKGDSLMSMQHGIFKGVDQCYDNDDYRRELKECSSKLASGQPDDKAEAQALKILGPEFESVYNSNTVTADEKKKLWTKVNSYTQDPMTKLSAGRLLSDCMLFVARERKEVASQLIDMENEPFDKALDRHNSDEKLKKERKTQENKNKVERGVEEGAATVNKAVERLLNAAGEMDDRGMEI